MKFTRITGNRTAEEIVREYCKEQAELQINEPKKEKPRAEPIKADPASLSELFILSHDDYGKELIAKSNALFAGTHAEIPVQGLADNAEIPNMHLLKRLALITAISRDSQLNSYKAFPITPLESEQLLQLNKLPGDPSTYWEDLGLILYDKSIKGKNPREARALYESIKEHKTDLRLSRSDLEEKLLIVNAGLDTDADMPHGVKPIILPGITLVYPHETLKQTGKNHKFTYGLQEGLPSPSELGTGSRTLHMPSENTDIGLRVLYRYRDLNLGAWYGLLTDSDSVGRVVCARRK